MIIHCDEIGHNWQATTVHGWFQCARAVKYTKKGMAFFCGMVAVCPGCLGHAIAGMQNIFCVTHFQTCTLADFPVVQPETVASPVDPLSCEQTSLW